MTINLEQKFLTKGEVAKQLRVSVSCIDAWIQSGKITPIKVGGRALFPVDLTVRNKKQAANA